MSEAKQRLRDLHKSTVAAPLVVPDAVIDQMNDPQAFLTLLVLQHQSDVKSDFKAQGDTLANVQEMLDKQNVVLGKHTDQLAAGAMKMDEIDLTTKATNGQVKVLRKEMDEVYPEVKLNTKDREARTLEEERVRLVREQWIFVPRKLSQLARVVWSKALYPLLGVMGAIGFAAPVLSWLWKLWQEHVGK
jgi:hypothetical protein